MVLKEALVAMTVSGVIRRADAWPDDLQIRSESDLKPFPGGEGRPDFDRNAVRTWAEWITGQRSELQTISPAASGVGETAQIPREKSLNDQQEE